MNAFKFLIENVSLDKEEFFRYARVFFDWIIHIFPTFWSYSLFNIDDHPITAGSIVLAIIFVVGGYMSIRLFVSYFDKRVLRSLDIETPHRYTIKVFLFYILISFLFLFTLHLIKVPLTVFTFFGGAIAIGVGFGLRNIMNNLICGIFIVTEHPIRVGDLIEVDNLVGVVEHIGFRATSVRSLENTHILIPNSIILEHSILNWTLSDKVIRSEITVGVGYNTSLEKVKEILLEVANDHDRVLTYNKNQTPVVFLDDFGGKRSYIQTQLLDRYQLSYGT